MKTLADLRFEALELWELQKKLEDLYLWYEDEILAITIAAVQAKRKRLLWLCEAQKDRLGRMN